ncbi:MAG: glycosyltransferase [Bacteroidia bacterium]|nr:glycosyltransferase [Bacteroidia bacterium]MDW8088527.1 glycosyltransferase [Bacteroidia bacterium]
MGRPDILYLTYDGLLDPLGQSQILPYLRGLQEALALHWHIISFEKARWRALRASLEEALRREGISWYPLSFSTRPPLVAKMYDAWRFLRAGQRLVRQHALRLLHARSYVAGWIAYQLSQQYRLPWIFDMRGFWADERRETHAWPKGHPFYDYLYKVWKRREQVMLESATAIVVLTEAAKKILEEWGVPPEKITVIPCTADYDHFRRQGHFRALYRQALGLPPEAYVLGYVGSIGPLYALDAMLELFRVLETLHPSSYLVFFTPAVPAAIYTAAQAQGIAPEKLRVHFIPRVELPQWLEVLDASIVFYRPGFSRAGTSPTRIAELLAMDIPVIAQADIGDNAALAQQLSGLYLVEALTPSAYEKVLTQLLESPPHGMRALSAPFLSLSVGVARYSALYQRLLSLTTPDANDMDQKP